MVYDKDGFKVALATEFMFSHLDPVDRTCAIFRDIECHDDIKPLLSKHLASMFEYGNPVHRPRIYIQIRHHANDTYMPDFESNWTALEIRCNWMGMYSEWFKEEKEHSRYLRDLVSAGTFCLALGHMGLRLVHSRWRDPRS